MSLFVKGIVSPFRALRIVREHPGLKRFFVVPFFINMLIIVGVCYVSAAHLFPWVQGLLPQGDAWYWTALRYVVAPLFFVLLGLAIMLFYSILGNIIMAPFNDPLSAKVERLLGGDSFDEPITVRGIVADMLRIAKSVAAMLALYLVYIIAIMFLNIIPLIGSPLYSLLSILGMGFFLGFQFFDFPLDRRKLGFRQKLGVVWGHKAMTIGLGLGFFALSLVPVFGFLGLNLGTVAATALFVEHIRPEMNAR